jgi:hypothetical protein
MCFEKSIEMWTQYGSGPHSDEAAQQLAEANIKMERSRLAALCFAGDAVWKACNGPDVTPSATVADLLSAIVC